MKRLLDQPAHSPHGLQFGPEAMGRVTGVVPSNAHAVTVGRVADYHAGCFPPAQTHSGADEQWPRRGMIRRRRLGGTRAGHNFEDNRGPL
jgi:hypothetical protein